MIFFSVTILYKPFEEIRWIYGEQIRTIIC